MRKARLFIVAIFALALLAVPATADAKRRDRDHDGLPDKWEKKHHLSTHKKSARKDPDRDGLNNRREFNNRTDPRDADTDNDALEDGDEIRVGDNPRDPDTDDDGVEDGDEFAGTVQSFDSGTGVLTILLADGTTRSGTVNDSTRIRCEDEGAEVHAAHNGGSDEGGNSGPGGGDNSGPGSGGSESGEDNSGPGSGGNESNCTTADLTPGRVVQEAELETEDGVVVFRKVELR